MLCRSVWRRGILKPLESQNNDCECPGANPSGAVSESYNSWRASNQSLGSHTGDSSCHTCPGKGRCLNIPTKFSAENKKTSGKQAGRQGLVLGQIWPSSRNFGKTLELRLSFLISGFQFLTLKGAYIDNLDPQLYLWTLPKVVVDQDEQQCLCC